MMKLISIFLISILPGALSAQGVDLFIGKKFENTRIITLDFIRVNQSKKDRYSEKLYVNESGYVSRSESRKGKKVKSWSEYSYTPDGQLLQEKNFSPYYQGRKRKPVEILSERWFTVSQYSYRSDRKLKQVLQFDSHDGAYGDTTVISYHYDSIGRPVEISRLDYSNGLEIGVEPNTSDPDTLYQYSTGNLETTTRITYHGDTTRETIYSGSESPFKKITIRQNSKIIEMVVDPQELPITTKTISLDKNGNIVRITTTIQAPEKISWDSAMGDDQRFSFSSQGLLTGGVLFEKGEEVEMFTVTYHP